MLEKYTFLDKNPVIVLKTNKLNYFILLGVSP